MTLRRASGGRNTCPFGTRNACPKPASDPRSAARATPTTTRWPRPSTGCTKPNGFTAGAPGKPGNPWNWPPCNGCIGSTTSDCSSRLGASLRQKLRQTTGGNSPVRPPHRPQLKPTGLLDTRGRSIREYIEIFHNRQRRHSRLGYLSPAVFAKNFRESAATH